MNTKTYSGNDFEVLWHPSVCTHSTKCWKGLRPVFDPFRKPWIILENGDREAIKTQVLACPSGALEWIENPSEAKKEVEISTLKPDDLDRSELSKE